MTVPQIEHVAVIYNGMTYSLPRPNRHHHVIRIIGGINGPHREGFIDTLGNYLSRTQAYTLATNNGQVNRDANRNELYSEDVW